MASSAWTLPSKLTRTVSGPEPQLTTVGAKANELTKHGRTLGIPTEPDAPDPTRSRPTAARTAPIIV